MSGMWPEEMTCGRGNPANPALGRATVLQPLEVRPMRKGKAPWAFAADGAHSRAGRPVSAFMGGWTSGRQRVLPRLPARRVVRGAGETNCMSRGRQETCHGRTEQRRTELNLDGAQAKGDACNAVCGTAGRSRLGLLR